MKKLFIVIDPAVQSMRGGYVKMFYDYIVENDISHEVNAKADYSKKAEFDLYYINSWGNISLFVDHADLKKSYPAFDMNVHPSVFWSRINKQNTFYTVEEWINIICGANSRDIESRMLSVALVKNADSSCLTLVKFVLNLICKHKIDDKDNYNINLLLSMYKKNNISQELNLEYYISLFSLVKGSNLIAEKALADPRILDICLNKYRHWLDFSNLRVKLSE